MWGHEMRRTSTLSLGQMLGFVLIASSSTSKQCLTVLQPRLDFVGDGFDERNGVLRIIFLVSE